MLQAEQEAGRQPARQAIVLLLFFAAALRAQPLLSPEDERFFEQQARRIVDSAALKAGEAKGKWRNTTPYDVHVPGGNMGYPAFWVRDAVMMLGGDFVGARELEGWIRLIASTIPGPRDWVVRPGVVVPAYAVPDHVNFNGKATFYPGNLETGEKQGGKPWGKYPPLDDHFYFLTAVYHHGKLTRGTALFDSRVKTSFREMPMADLCERVYRVAPSDPETALVTAGDVETENAKDFGFCDTVGKSGKLLFPSVLKYLAARQMAELFEASGRPAKARRYHRDAERIRAAIPPTFYRASKKEREGWLHSATGVGNQPDVWGSAFALWSGAVDGHTAGSVGRALVRAYREKTAVRQGCVRHILTSDPTNQGHWQVAVSRPGEYQNGGYWGTPTGWYIAAMHRNDPAAAREMARDFLAFLRGSLRPDGLVQAWEWINPDTGRDANPLYAATVALPYLSLKAAGLVGTETGKPASGR